MNSFADILGIGTPELILILLLLLLLFGARKLPELTKSIGQSVKELKKGLSDDPKNAKNENEKSNEYSES